MRFLNSAWRKLTNTDAIQLASGKLELYFFESLYRVVYLFGLSISDSSVAYLIYSTTIKVLLLLLVSLGVWQFFSINLTIDAITDGVNLIFIQFGALCKYIVMVRNKKVYKNLAASMESENFDLTTPERNKILEIWRIRSDRSLKLLIVLGTCTVIFWQLYPLMDDLEYNLMVFARIPFNYQTPTLYPPTYGCVLIVFSYMCYFVMTNDLIMQAHFMNLLCQYSILNDCLRNILTDCQSNLKGLNVKTLHLNDDFKRTYKKRLGNLSEQHRFILDNTLKLRDLLSVPMLIQLAISTTLICSIGFQVATSVNVNMTKWLSSTFYLAYNMFVLYVICRWCEEIKIQSELIGEAVYCSGWEGGIVVVPGVRSSILLILARANKPTYLSAGGMYDLSLEAYANIVKTSYTALTVLLRLR